MERIVHSLTNKIKKNVKDVIHIDDILFVLCSIIYGCSHTLGGNKTCVMRMKFILINETQNNKE